MPVSLLESADTLDRQSGRRGDSAYLSAHAAAPDARYLVLCGLDPVVHHDSRKPWFSGNELTRAGLVAKPAVFLGVARQTDVAHFACQITSAERDHLAGALDLAVAADFRTLASNGGLDPADIALAGLARALFAWHESGRHCGWCGAPTALIDGGWKRHCAACVKDIFPRLDPVVIMLVTDGEHCVLAHEPRYPEGMYSTIAGYIEPGEDIAHAVARETAEELGIAVGSVAYLASQPWPFPHSLMIGCIARCTKAPLVIDPTEITAARWFTRAEAALMLARRHPEGLWVPGPQAIAHHLIGAFIEGV